MNLNNISQLIIKIIVVLFVQIIKNTSLFTVHAPVKIYCMLHDLHNREFFMQLLSSVKVSQ